MGTSGLMRADLLTALDLVRRIEGAPDVASFQAEALAGLRELVGCDVAHLGLLDPSTGRAVAIDDPPGTIGSAPARAGFERHFRQDPWIAPLISSAEPRALKVSDFLDLRGWKATEVYNECHRLVGTPYEIGVRLPTSNGPVHCAVLLRESRDFTERDRDLLTLLAPQISTARENAALRQLHLAIERADGATGVALIPEVGPIEAANSAANELLTAYFNGASRPPHLPADLERWVAAQRERRERAQPDLEPATLSIDGERGRLVIRLLPGGDSGEPDALVLSESHRPLDPESLRAPGLTRRESEVLALAALGLGDKRIAVELGVSGRTVGKHLERVYAKLGVTNRTAAAAAARRISEGDE